MFDNVRRVSRQLFAYGTADVMVLVVNFLLLPVYTRVLIASRVRRAGAAAVVRSVSQSRQSVGAGSGTSAALLRLAER